MVSVNDSRNPAEMLNNLPLELQKAITGALQDAKAEKLIGTAPRGNLERQLQTFLDQ